MFQPIRYKNLDHKSNLTNLNKQPSNKPQILSLTNPFYDVTVKIHYL